MLIKYTKKVGTYRVVSNTIFFIKYPEIEVNKSQHT